MLFILLGVFIFLLVAVTQKQNSICRNIFTALLSIIVLSTFFLIVIAVTDYLNLASVGSSKIESIEKHNNDIIHQMQPVVLRNSPKDMLKHYNGDVQGMITLCSTPELQQYNTIRVQAELLVNNQSELAKLRQEQSRIEKYKLLIFAF